MTASNFTACLKFTLRYEGGYVDHPRDPGGATNLGITIGTLAAWRKKSVSKADVRNLRHEEAAAIYRERYWKAVQGDLLPAGVDLAVFDFAVNSGTARAAKALQAAVGVRQDGVIAIGGDTLAAVDKMHPGEIIKRICDNRLTFVKKLKTWGTFGKGWSARISAVRTTATSMVSGGMIKVVAVEPDPEAAAKAPTTDVAPQTTSVGKATVVTGVAGAATAAASAGDLIAAGKSVQSYSDALPWLTVVGGLIVAVGVAWFLWPEIKRLVRGQGKEEIE
jgi:lysozyme family protein